MSSDYEVRHSLRLYGPFAPGTSSGTLFTASGDTCVTNIHAVNTTAADATLSIGIQGSAATAGNLFVPAITIPAHGSYDWDCGGGVGLPLASGEFMTALQGTSSAITLTISGVSQ